MSVKFGLLKDQAISNKQQIRKCSLTFECDRTKENPNTHFTIRAWLPEDFETKKFPIYMYIYFVELEIKKLIYPFQLSLDFG